MLSREEWQPLRKNLRLLFRISMYKEYWDREKEIYTPAFSNEINVILKEMEGLEEETLPVAVSHLVDKG